MLRTRLCDLLGIEHPVIQAGMGPVTTAELVATVSNAGGLGSLGATPRPIEEFRQHLACIPELTDRPFAVNHLIPLLNEEAVALTLEAKPAVISLALGDPPSDLVERAHGSGILVMHQVHTVGQARQAAERGVDIIIAQGSEAGGNCGTVSALALVPQVVDAVSPIPVVAAGGIADGRGLAAVLVLGAQGINIGTRFLASKEAGGGESWKQAILAAESEDTLKVEFWNDIFPPPTDGYDTSPRALRTPFIEEWQQRREEARREAERLRGELMTAVQQGRMHEMTPLTGQTTGLIHEILPAGQIVRRIVAEGEQALREVASLPQ